MPAQDQKSYGPKTFILSSKGLGIIVATTGKEELTVNDSPRAKQSWQIENVFFNFPGAFMKPAKRVAADKQGMEFEFVISMFIGGVEVASQKFLDRSQCTTTPAEEPFRAVGSLEPYKGAAVYPGQSLRFVLEVKKYFLANGEEPTEPAKEGTFELEQGSIIVNYTLNVD